MLSAALLAFFRPEPPGKASQRTLTFEQRVDYQRAIEEVYWRHRIWPKERLDPKPSLDAVMPEAQLETKVADYLRKSRALEDYWQRSITAEQLQAEMDRMATHTKQPEVLREIFAALGNDPFIIAECLARPILSERLKPARAERRKGTLASLEARAPLQVTIPVAAVSANYSLPAIAGPSDGCANDTWTRTSTTNAPDARGDWSNTAVWTGSEMIVWGGYGGSSLNTGGRYNPSTDSWTATSTTNAPDARSAHTAVWTGSEMIVWGGTPDGLNRLNTGGRYSPSTDSWIATTTSNAPSAREFHTAVWTGSEMIVWGGYNSGVAFNTGGRYNPSTDSWTATNTTNAPAARYEHTAVWTGSQMIVWGGTGGLPTGGRYNPSTDSWTATSTANAPTDRFWHTAVWTGSQMIVWGGYNGSAFNTGGRYNPSTDSWTVTSTTDAPAARYHHRAVWTGSEMIVWGGFNSGVAFNSGGRYNPSTDSWTATNTTNAPTARDFHMAVWTGSQMIVWGGYDGTNYFNTGGKYCAQSGAPSPTPTATPCASVAVWTEQAPYPIAVGGNAVASQGGNVYSFGGIANNTAVANAYKYTPATNTWTPIAFLPEPRYWFSAATDGTYIYLLGGLNENGLPRANLWRYDPVSDTYNTSLPPYTIATYFHASAYLNGKIYRIAGRGMGTDFHVEFYDIATNSWSMAANYPFANQRLMAVALGGYIYAGGGNGESATYRYDPSTNTWDDAAIADLPALRSDAASSVYNGRWLLAGGEVNFAISNSAIAWDPATNTWSNLPNMVQARQYLGAGGATAGESFYAVAGDSGPGTPSNDNQQYTETGCITPTPSPTATATATATPTATFTPTPTATPTATATATRTPTPTATATATPTPTATITPTPTPMARLGNISTRSFVQTSDNVMIGGFIVQGTQPKRVIIRAIGPELSQYGVPDPLQDPTLELHDGTGALIATNDNWQTTIIGGIITHDQVQEIQDSGYAPGDPRESAIIADLPAGNYTAIVRGVNSTTGVALVEVYDLSPQTNLITNTNSILGNISTRSFVQTGDNVMIGGFIVQGTQPKRVIIRAIGPELSQYGVPDPLQDPTLELHDGTGALIGRNDNWQTTIIGGVITHDQVQEIQDSGYAPGDGRESAIIAELPAGNYTAIVRGVNSTTGVALVEVYDLH